MIDKEKQGKTQLIDVMLGDGSFFCQLKYTGKPFPKIISGKVVEEYDKKDLRAFALQKRPSLAGKKFYVELTNQRVY
jgi:hypothetical protein